MPFNVACPKAGRLECTRGVDRNAGDARRIRSRTRLIDVVMHPPQPGVTFADRPGRVGTGMAGIIAISIAANKQGEAAVRPRPWEIDGLAAEIVPPPDTAEPHEFVLRRLDEITDWNALCRGDGRRPKPRRGCGSDRIAYPEVDPQSEVVPLALMTVDPILDAAGPNLRIGC